MEPVLKYTTAKGAIRNFRVCKILNSRLLCTGSVREEPGKIARKSELVEAVALNSLINKLGRPLRRLLGEPFPKDHCGFFSLHRYFWSPFCGPKELSEPSLRPSNDPFSGSHNFKPIISFLTKTLTEIVWEVLMIPIIRTFLLQTAPQFCESSNFWSTKCGPKFAQLGYRVIDLN